MRLRTPKRFRTMAGVRRFVASILANLSEGQVDTDRARVMIYGAKVLSELIRDSELEKRVLDLERKASNEPRAAVQ